MAEVSMAPNAKDKSNSAATGTAAAAPEEQDVYKQLAQKETDLILAAELGKALLEKNEELGRQNDAMGEEFAQKIEVSFP